MYFSLTSDYFYLLSCFSLINTYYVLVLETIKYSLFAASTFVFLLSCILILVFLFQEQILTMFLIHFSKNETSNKISWWFKTQIKYIFTDFVFCVQLFVIFSLKKIEQKLNFFSFHIKIKQLVKLKYIFFSFLLILNCNTK